MTSITRNNHHQKRLIIVIDGNAMLVKYWPTIIYENLEKIIRCFFYNSQEQEQENNSVSEVGVVVYAAKANNNEPHVKSLNWTKDMEFLLSCLPTLELIGDDSDRLVMNEGLIEAIMMFVKEPEYNGQKHCILVAMREPLAVMKTLLDVPVIQDGQYCGLSERRDIDIFEVVQMFAKLNISFSLITPAVHPIFRGIFNMGNGVEESEYNLLEGRSGEILVLFSRTFLEAHPVLHPDALTTMNNTNFGVEASQAAHGVTIHPNIMYSIMDLPAVETVDGEQALDSDRALRLLEDVPNATLAPERQRHEEDHYSIGDLIDELIMNKNNHEEEEFDGVRRNSSAPLAVSSFEDLLNPNQETMVLGQHSGGGLHDVYRRQALRISSTTTTTINNKGKDKVILIDDDDDDSLTQAAFSSMGNVPSIHSNAPSPMVMMNVLESSGGMGVPNPNFNLGSSSSNPTPPHVLESSTVAGPSQEMQQVEVHDAITSGMISPGIEEPVFEINNTNSNSISFEPAALVTTHNNQYIPSSSSSYYGGGVADYYSSLFHNNAQLESNNNSAMLHQFEQSSSSSAIVPYQQQVMPNDYYFNNFQQEQAPPITHHNAATMGGVMDYSSLLLQFQQQSSSSSAALNQNYYYLHGANYSSAQFPSYYYGNDNNATMGGNYSSSSSSMMIPYEYGVGGGGGASSGYFTELMQTQQQYAQQQGLNNQHLAGPSTIPTFQFHSSYLDSNQYLVFTWEGTIIASTYPTGGVTSYRAKAYRKRSSSIELTLLWKTKIFVNNYIPQSTVEHTKSLMKSKIDSVFFHLTESNNLDLYNLLITKKLYAKIDLPAQKLILSPTENSLCYEGIVFPGDTFFIEAPNSY